MDGTVNRAMSAPVVTVGLPVYNGARFLSAAIETVLNQTYRNLELVISDNASSDDTEAICREWIGRDSRVTYVRQAENLGAAWNYNKLPELAGGKYFKWHASDDLLGADFLERAVRVLERDPAVVLVSARTTFIDEEGNPIKKVDPGWDLQSESAQERLQAVLLKGGHWENADALIGLIRTDILKRTQMLPRYQGGDKLPLTELSLFGKFVQIPDYLLFRRRHSAASNMNNPAFRGYDSQSINWMKDFFGGTRWGVCIPTWCLLFDKIKVVSNSRLGSKSKFTVAGTLLKACWWQRSFLGQELKAGMRMLLRPALRKDKERLPS